MNTLLSEHNIAYIDKKVKYQKTPCLGVFFDTGLYL